MTAPAMLFTAGLGTRMAPLTDHLPKPMVEVAGRPLVDHALEVLHGAGVTRIVANTHHLPDMIAPHLQRAGVTCVHEEVLLDTGGGLKNALPRLGPGPVVTLNTDAVWLGPNPVQRLLSAWQPDRMEALMLLVPLSAAVAHSGKGDFGLEPDGRLRRGGDRVYTGLQILRPDKLEEISEAKFSLNRIWDLMAAEGRLFGAEYDGLWCDVGRPDAIPLAEAMLGTADV